MSLPSVSLNFTLPPNTTSTLPAHLASPETHKVWSAVAQNAREVQVHGTTVRNPVVFQAPADTSRSLPTDSKPVDTELPPAEGFILGGDLDVFKIEKLKGTLRSWHGPAPTSVGRTLTSPVFQHVTLNQSCQVSDLFPSVVDTVFNAIKLDNVMFTYQNYAL
jgi:hypothetical protein